MSYCTMSGNLSLLIINKKICFHNSTVSERSKNKHLNKREFLAFYFRATNSLINKRHRGNRLEISIRISCYSGTKAINIRDKWTETRQSDLILSSRHYIVTQNDIPCCYGHVFRILNQEKVPKSPCTHQFDTMFYVSIDSTNYNVYQIKVLGLKSVRRLV